MTETGSTVPRRQLGRHLRHLRELAGTTLQAAADSLEWSRARMYRIEVGQVSLRSHDVLAICELYRAPAELTDVLVSLARQSRSKGWWQGSGEALPSWFELYVGLEAAAGRIRTFEADALPELLQTREYAEAVIRSRPGVEGSELDRRVSLRLRRAQLLRRTRPAAPDLEAIVDEAALRRPIGDRPAMHRQLSHLIDVAAQPQITVRVLPLRAGPCWAAGTGSFTILDFPDLGIGESEPTTVYRQHLAGAAYLNKPGEVATYLDAWHQLGTLALDEPSSGRLITAIGSTS